MAEVIRYPLTITWYITSKCNLKCEFCYFCDRGEKSFSIEQYEEITKQITALKPFSVSLIGGEVFVHPFAFEIIEMLSSSGIIVNLATNATLLDEDKIKRLAKVKYIGYVQVSIDGSSSELNDSIRGHGVFNKAISAIKLMKSMGMTVDISTLICKKNKHDLISIISLANEYGIRQIVFNLFIPNGRGKYVQSSYSLDKHELKQVFDEIEIFEKSNNLDVLTQKPLYGKYINNTSGPKNKDQEIIYGCGAGRKKFLILPNGDVCACENLTDPPDIEDNLFNRKLYDIWFDPNNFNKWRNLNELGGKCKDCQQLDNCYGGCRANAVYYYGDFYADDPLCWINLVSQER